MVLSHRLGDALDRYARFYAIVINGLHLEPKAEGPQAQKLITATVSSQTLHRGVKAENTSYRQIKAEARRGVVESNIADVSLTLSHILVLAGFAEANGLVRAMKSWTGLSPSAFRRSIIEEDGEAQPGHLELDQSGSPH